MICLHAAVLSKSKSADSSGTAIGYILAGNIVSGQRLPVVSFNGLRLWKITGKRVADAVPKRRKSPILQRNNKTKKSRFFVDITLPE